MWGRDWYAAGWLLFSNRCSQIVVINEFVLFMFYFGKHRNSLLSLVVSIYIEEFIILLYVIL